MAFGQTAFITFLKVQVTQRYQGIAIVPSNTQFVWPSYHPIPSFYGHRTIQYPVFMAIVPSNTHFSWPSYNPVLCSFHGRDSKVFVCVY